MRFAFTIPGKPMPLQRARVVRLKNGRMHAFTPQESVDYQAWVRQSAIFAKCPLFAPGCAVWLSIYLPDRKVRDRDNIEKGIVDALQGQWSKKLARWVKWPVAWRNDHEIGDVHRFWHVDPANPRVEVTIEGELAEPPGQGVLR